LSSQVEFETATSCLKHLNSKLYLDTIKIVNNPIILENLIVEELSKPIYPPFKNGKGRKFRFPKSRADYIVRTAVNIYKNNNTNIKNILEKCKCSEEARKVLIKNAIGIGYKQASMYLRNIAYSEDFAILDSHVLKYMNICNLIKKEEITDLSSKYKYLHLENIFKNYATLKGKSMQNLDLAIWVVMRQMQRI